MVDALAAAMRTGETALWWYLGTSAVAIGSIAAALALGGGRRG